MNRKQLTPEQWKGVVNAVGRHTGVDYHALESELGEAFSDCFDDFNDFDEQWMLHALPIQKRDNLYYVKSQNGIEK